MTPRRRLLIVDDHAGFRRSARILLEAEGFVVVGESADGDSAVALATRLEPDVVLLDIVLPTTDGFDVCARLLRDQAGLRVVLTSTYDVDLLEDRVAASGAAGFIPKAELSGDAIDALIGRPA
ncbi:response regulator transcription factor [Microbacterium sp. B2969]|uniref:Response regulator transcription factor n=1 Tax=Microbacterium alkaliflavum TaxID=3248839 RepID=A0ABW7QDI5_9MICO